MASRQHTSIAWSALASIAIALAIGSVPVVALTVAAERFQAAVQQVRP